MERNTKIGLVIIIIAVVLIVGVFAYQESTHSSTNNNGPRISDIDEVTDPYHNASGNVEVEWEDGNGNYKTVERRTDENGNEVQVETIKTEGASSTIVRPTN